LYFNWKTLLIAIRKISEIDRRVWAMLALTPWVAVQHIGLFHRDKTRVLMPAKMFPHLKLLCWQFLGPTLGFDTKQRNSFFDQIWCGFFTIKARFWQYYSLLNMRKLHFNDEFSVLLGTIISRFFHFQMRKKINKKKRVCALVLFVWIVSIHFCEYPGNQGKDHVPIVCFWLMTVWQTSPR